MSYLDDDEETQEARRVRCHPLPEDDLTTRELLQKHVNHDPSRLVLDHSKTTMLQDDTFFSDAYRRGEYFKDGKLKPLWNVDSVKTTWTRSRDCAQRYNTYKEHCDLVMTDLGGNTSTIANTVSAKARIEHISSIVETIDISKIDTFDDLGAVSNKLNKVAEHLRHCLDGRKAYAAYCKRGTDRGHDVEYHMLYTKVYKQLQSKEELIKAFIQGAKVGAKVERKRKQINPYFTGESSGSDDSPNDHDVKRGKITQV